jgi:hypothetical protein
MQRWQDLTDEDYEALLAMALPLDSQCSNRLLAAIEQSVLPPDLIGFYCIFVRVRSLCDLDDDEECNLDDSIDAMDTELNAS